MYSAETIKNLIDILLTALLINSVALSFYYKIYFNLFKGIFNKDNLEYDTILETIHDRDAMDTIRETSLFINDNGIFLTYLLINILSSFLLVPLIANLIPLPLGLFKITLVFIANIFVISRVIVFSRKLFKNKVILLFVPNYIEYCNPIKVSDDFKFKKVKFLEKNNKGEFKFFSVFPKYDPFPYGNGEETGALCQCLVVGTFTQIVLITLISIFFIISLNS